VTDQQIDAALVEQQLAALVAWPDIARSPQLVAFLRYIVAARLEGRQEQVKAYAVAVDVFGRPTDFDPQQDPIVRVQARRLRALLARYYNEVAPDAPLHITLPTGRYIPEFQLSAEQPVVPPPARAPRRAFYMGRRHWALAGLIALVFAFAGALWATIGPQRQGQSPVPVAAVPAMPRVLVRPFQAAANEGDVLQLARALSVEVASDLELFGELDVRYGDGAAGDYVLSGVLRPGEPGAQASVVIAQDGAAAATWSYAVLIDATSEAGIDSASRRFAERLGDPRGPLHAVARQWLVGNEVTRANASRYLCQQLYHRWRDSGLVNDRSRTSSCLAALDARPPSPPLLAISAAIAADHVEEQRVAGAVDPVVANAAEEISAKALAGASTSGFVWEQRAWALKAVQRQTDAETAFRAALQLNPAAVDARAGLAALLLERGPSEEGRRLADEALSALAEPPAWYRRAVALDALRRGDDGLALSEAEVLARRDPEMAAVIAAVAAERLGRQDVLGRFLSQILEASRYRSHGLQRVLTSRIADDRLVTDIVDGLRRAGIAQDFITGQQN
jgi:tetratricopeptide (TPR) repeat protein